MTETKVTIYNLHPKEAQLIDLVRSLGFGEIRSLKVHNGLPELAEVDVTQKHKFV
jgi:cell division protein FtsX